MPPSHYSLEPVLLGASASTAKIVTPVVAVTKRLIKNWTFRNTFHLEFDVTRLTGPQLWCSNAMRALDNVI